MAIVIVNETPEATLCTYSVRIDNGPEIVRFTHKRTGGLASCLKKAAKAVKEQKAADELKAIQELKSLPPKELLEAYKNFAKALLK